MTTVETLQADVARAVEEGFAKDPKRLPSWLFYDETGDRLFQAIMRMPEYYLTPCEYEILQMNKERLRQRFAAHGTSFDLVEFGAGDGMKTEVLLRHFSEQHASFKYLPVDVSSTALNQLTQRLQRSVPDLSINSINKRYDQAVRDLYEEDLSEGLPRRSRKVFLFLGANIGNFALAEATHFTSTISAGMKNDDLLLIGFDLKKDPRLIQAAYDDPHGITRNFNLNLLTRLNRELGAHFLIDQFRHYPYYDPETGITKSYLVSQVAQDVYIGAFDKSVHFNRWEIVHTEVSQKYDLPMIAKMAAAAGLTILDHYHDCKHYFCDVLFGKKS